MRCEREITLVWNKEAAKYVRAASRLAGRSAGQNRYARATWSGVRTTLRSYRRIFHMLFLEVTGVFFLFFALTGTFAVVREYRGWSAGKTSAGRLVLALGFALMFLWFAVSSFRRARKKNAAADAARG